MSSLTYATGNEVKFQQAVTACQEFGIDLEQANLDVPEIQSEDGELVARDKAEKAFAKFAGPIVISDDNWNIPGLNGFPGPYMKSINSRFSVGDWLRLTKDLVDRRIILEQLVVYQDASGQQLFNQRIEETLLKESRGESPFAHSHIVSFNSYGKSNAEFHQRAESDLADVRNSWHDFAEWYTASKTAS